MMELYDFYTWMHKHKIHIEKIKKTPEPPQDGVRRKNLYTEHRYEIYQQREDRRNGIVIYAIDLPSALWNMLRYKEVHEGWIGFTDACLKELGEIFDEASHTGGNQL